MCSPLIPCPKSIFPGNPFCLYLVDQILWQACGLHPADDVAGDEVRVKVSP